jgi:peptidoglycan/xylan/chitin deacetylase (PgdA/CDA1 family)
VTERWPGTARGVNAWCRRKLRGAALRTSPQRRRAAPPGSVALTFDDGPDPRFTPQVLDVLAAHGATATFFLVGRNARRHPELVRRIEAAGHGIGSHTWSHRESPELSTPALLGELWRGRRALEDILGRRVRGFRPPKGYFDGRLALGTRLAGMQTWQWSVDPEDWRPGATCEAILRGVDALGERDVVVLHDGVEQPWDASALDRSATVAALPGIIALARSRRLEPRRLDLA